MIMQDDNGIRYYLKISKIAKLSNFYLAQDIPAIFQDEDISRFLTSNYRKHMRL